MRRLEISLVFNEYGFLDHTGFHEDNGFRLTKIPAVRARIEELASEPSQRIRAGIDAELLMLRNRTANEDLDAEGRANIELRLKLLLLAHVKLRGWIVDKKQVAKLSASVRLDRAELDAALLALTTRIRKTTMTRPPNSPRPSNAAALSVRTQPTARPF